MAAAANRSAHPPARDRDAPPAGGGRRAQRLAELVTELTPYDDDLALDAIRVRNHLDDPLEIVARAITGLRRGDVVEPQDRFRVAGFLRSTPDPLPRRRGHGTTAVTDHTSLHLVHHGSLRRWERTGVDDQPGYERLDEAGSELDEHGEAVIDLRDRTARFRRPAR